MAFSSLQAQRSPLPLIDTNPRPMVPSPAFIPIAPLPQNGGGSGGSVGYPISG